MLCGEQAADLVAGYLFLIHVVTKALLNIPDLELIAFLSRSSSLID